MDKAGVDPVLLFVVILILIFGLRWIFSTKDNPQHGSRSVYPNIESEDDSTQYTVFPDADTTWSRSSSNGDPAFHSQAREELKAFDDHKRLVESNTTKR